MLGKRPGIPLEDADSIHGRRDRLDWVIPPRWLRWRITTVSRAAAGLIALALATTASAQAPPTFSNLYDEIGAQQQFGAALATGDLDGDGDFDLVVGAPVRGGGQRGAVLVYIAITSGNICGSGNAPSYVVVEDPQYPGQPLLLKGPRDQTRTTRGLGSSLALMDWDSDGDLDIVAGAPYSDVKHKFKVPIQSGAGLVCVFKNTSLGPGSPDQVQFSTTPTVLTQPYGLNGSGGGPQDGAFFGYSVGRRRLGVAAPSEAVLIGAPTWDNDLGIEDVGVVWQVRRVCAGPTAYWCGIGFLPPCPTRTVMISSDGQFLLTTWTA